ncbi:hypothetical protein FNX44_016980, partial [Streptomyces sp. OF1]|nr:hypothetical protein [Streptomyces alkaliterrae]
MSQMTQRAVGRDGPARIVNWLAEGALAACLGVAAVAMLVLVLWIASPHPHGGPDEALRIAAGVWLLAHGVALVRAETLGGGTAPMGVTPILLTALPLFLLYRVARAADGRAWRIVLWLGAGYLLVAVGAALFTVGGPLRVAPLSATLVMPAVTAATVGAGVWSARGRPLPADGTLRLPAALPERRLFDAVRAGLAAAGALCAVGALLVAGSLVWHWHVAAEDYTQLTAAWSGRMAVLALCLALAPNAAVWGAAYGLGPGFTLGAGSAVGPLAADGLPQLPHFPLLAAVPAEGPAGSYAWGFAAAVPLAGGLVAGRFTARAAVPVLGDRHGSESAARTSGASALAGCCCGLAMALLAAFAGGPLGTGALAEFGPTWWLTGAAAAGWTAAVAVPGALVARWWRLREPHPLLAVAIGARRARARAATRLVSGRRKLAAARRRVLGGGGRRRAAAKTAPADDWHSTGTRHSRWAALKKASGGLVPSLDTADRPLTPDRDGGPEAVPP